MKNVARWRKTSFVLKSATAMKFTVLERSPAVHFENKHRELKLSFKGFLKRQFTRRLCVGDSSMWSSKRLDQ